MTRHGRVAPALIALLMSGAGVGTAEAGRAASTSRNAQAYHLYSLAVQSLLDRDYADAVALMEAAAQREPAPELLLEAARLHFSLNNSERAIDLAQLIVDGMPEHSGAHRLLGDISINLAREGPDYDGQVAIAEREYRAALASNPLDDETCRILAEIYYQTGRLDQAADLLESFSRIADLDPKQALLLGKIYIHSGHRDKARTLLENVVARTPGSYEAIDTLAALYEFQGDFDAAIKAYDSLLMSGAPNAYLSERLGSLLVRAGRYEEAVILLEESRRLDPDNGRGLVPLAQAYQKLHDGPGALRLYDERLEREPADLEARFHRARLRGEEGDQEGALVGFQEVVVRAGGDGGDLPARETNILALAYSQIGLMMLGARDYDAATEAFGRAIDISPEPRPEMFLLLGRAELRRGAPRATQRIVAQAMRRYPDDIDLQILEGEALIARGERSRARRYYHELLDERGHPAGGYLGVSEALLRQNWYDEAEAFLEEATQMHPSDDRLFFARGAALERLGRIGEAEEQLVKAIGLNPTNAMALNYLGYMLADRGLKLNESVAYIERALALEPRNPAYLDSLGWALFRLARYDGAEEHLRAAAQYDRYDPTIREHLGDLLIATGRPEEALQQWETALGSGHEEPERLQRKLEEARALLQGSR